MHVRRSLRPEILDELDATDARALRSRRDLRLVNHFMRGEAWIARQITRMDGIERVVELGAGEGHLAAELKRRMPQAEVVALDLAPRPQHLDERVIWWQGNVLDYECYDSGTMVVANLFLHHLTESELGRLGAIIRGSYGLLAAEPHRGQVGMVLGRCLFPFVNDVTRHDMLVSIRAGFRPRELAGFLHTNGEWQWSEQRGWFGGIRTKALAA